MRGELGEQVRKQVEIPRQGRFAGRHDGIGHRSLRDGWAYVDDAQSVETAACQKSQIPMELLVTFGFCPDIPDASPFRELFGGYPVRGGTPFFRIAGIRRYEVRT
jgi:hypothetical protein